MRLKNKTGLLDKSLLLAGLGALLLVLVAGSVLLWLAGARPQRAPARGGFIRWPVQSAVVPMNALTHRNGGSL